MNEISTGNRSKETSTACRVGLVLLVVWLLVRMAVVLPVFQEPARVQFADPNTYLELANNLIDRGEYVGDSYDRIDLVRTPIYPLFLAAILKVFGRNLAFVALFQLLITIGTCGLVYATLGRLFDRRIALAGAWVYALNPNSLILALVALTETVFTAIFILALYLLVRYREAGDVRWLALSALTLGATALVRPIVLWLLPIWGVFVLFAPSAHPWRERIIRVLAVAAIAWLVFLPWQIRNYAVHDAFTLSPVGRATIRNWMIAEGLAEAKGITRNQAAAEIASAENPDRYSLEVLVRYPQAMAIATLRGVYRTVMGFEYGSWTHLLGVARSPGRSFLNAALALDVRAAWREGLTLLRAGHLAQLGIVLWALGYNLALYALAAWGAITLWRGRRSLWFLALLLTVTAYLLLSPAGAGQARFRIPAAPGLAMLAGIGLAGRRTSRERPS